MNKVLVTAIGSFSADIVIKKLKSRGYYVIGTDIYPKEWIVDASNVDFFIQVPPASNYEMYWKSIQKICSDMEIKYIIPSTDVEIDILNQYRDWFENRHICLCVSSFETINLCRDKKVLYDFIKERNLSMKTIPTVMLSEQMSPPFDYPFVCKPCNGRSSSGFCIFHNEEEWIAFLNKKEFEKYIVQPYISGDIITVDVVRSAKNRSTVSIVRKELLRTSNGAGTSVYVYEDEKLEQTSKILADALNIQGCVNFEFICTSEGIVYFIECNPRFSGGVEFSCMAGYDCVSNHMRCFTNENIEDFKLSSSFYIARKYEEYITKAVPEDIKNSFVAVKATKQDNKIDRAASDKRKCPGGGGTP